MVFLTKTYNKIFYKKLKVIYSLKVYTDFIFFNFLVQEYITLYNISLLKFLKTFIYLLNLVAIKYILFIHYFNVFYIKNYVENRIYILELFYWKNKHFTNINNTTTNNIEQKILLIKKISRTRKKGRIKRYKVVILIGNKSG